MLLSIVLVLNVTLPLSFSDVIAGVVSQNITTISGCTTKDSIKNPEAILLINIDTGFLFLFTQ